jgi:hypothetical protein
MSVTDGDYNDDGTDNSLGGAAALDSDEIRNDDGDIVVDPPDQWIDAKEDETLDERLADEVPDVVPAGEPDPIVPDKRTEGQISGTPEDGGSFFTVVDEDEQEPVPGDDEADAVIVDDDEADALVDEAGAPIDDDIQ